jgi:hypothetical protein
MAEIAKRPIAAAYIGKRLRGRRVMGSWLLISWSFRLII